MNRMSRKSVSMSGNHSNPLLARGRGLGRLRTMSAVASIRKVPSVACVACQY